MTCSQTRQNASNLALAFAIVLVALSPGAFSWDLVNESTGSFDLGGTPNGNLNVGDVNTNSNFSETFSNPSTDTTTTASGSGGGGGLTTITSTISYAEELKEQEDVTHIENTIKNNPILQNAIKDIFGLKELTEEQIKKVAEKSAEAAKSTTISRSISITSGKTSVSMSFSYSGSGKISNFMIYDTVPKSFAPSADNITVIAGGAIVKVIENDPVYSFTYQTISEGDTKTVNYAIGRQLSKSVLSSFSAPVIVVSETPSNEPPATTPEPTPAPISENPPIETEPKGTEDNGTGKLLQAVLLIIAAVVVLALLNKQFEILKKKKHPASHEPPHHTATETQNI